MEFLGIPIFHPFRDAGAENLIWIEAEIEVEVDSSLLAF